MTSLFEWFVVANVYAPRGGPCTHTSLAGGRFFIPRAHTNTFLDHYAAVVTSGRAATELFFVERTGRLKYRMFADFDIRSSGAGADADADADALLDEALRGIPRGSELRGKGICILRRQRHAGKEGFHLVWPDLYVDDKLAMALCQDWLVALDSAKFGAVIDLSVYRNGSLRMPWSVKGPGADAAGAYVPWRIVRVHSDEPPSVEEEFPGATSDFRTVRRWLGLATLHPRDFAVTIPQRRQPHAPSTKTGAETAKGSVPGGVASVLASVLSSLVDERWRGSFERAPLVVRDVLVETRPPRVIVTTASRLCARVQRSHRSNHTYFVIVRRSSSTFACSQFCHGCRMGALHLGVVDASDMDPIAWAFLAKNLPA